MMETVRASKTPVLQLHTSIDGVIIQKQKSHQSEATRNLDNSPQDTNHSYPLFPIANSKPAACIN